MSKKVSEQKDGKMTATKKIIGIAAAAGSVGLLAAGTIAAKLLRLRKAKAEEDENVELLETKDDADQTEEETEDSLCDGPEVVIQAGEMGDEEESEDADETAEEAEPEAPAEADDTEEKADETEPAEAETETEIEETEAEETAADDSETAEA